MRSPIFAIHALDFPVSKGLLQEGLHPIVGSPRDARYKPASRSLHSRDIEQSVRIARRILAEGSSPPIACR